MYHKYYPTYAGLWLENDNIFLDKDIKKAIIGIYFNIFFKYLRNSFSSYSIWFCNYPIDVCLDMPCSTLMCEIFN